MPRSVDIFRITNANHRRKMYLAESRDDAVQMALIDGHIRARKNAWKVEEGVVNIAASDHKFASALDRAIAAEATGPVISSDGAAIVHSQIFLPLSLQPR